MHSQVIHRFDSFGQIETGARWPFAVSPRTQVASLAHTNRGDTLAEAR